MIDVIGSTLVSFKTRGWLEDVKWVILEQDRLKRAISRLERLLKK